MNLKDKIYLRKLAFNAFNLYIEKFSLEDDDYIDYRAVRGKERALNNCIKEKVIDLMEYNLCCDVIIRIERNDVI